MANAGNIPMYPEVARAIANRGAGNDYGGGGGGDEVGGVLSALWREAADRNKERTLRELDNVRQLSQSFEDFATDPRYSNQPDLQREAHQHAVAVQALYGEKKKLPKEYQYDEKAGGVDHLGRPMGGVPAFIGLTQRALQRQMAKTGEPPKPSEPAKPSPPPPPNFDSAFMDQGAMNAMQPPPPPAGTPPAAPMASTPQSGGQKLGPNAITTAPAIPGPPLAPPPAPAGPMSAGPNTQFAPNAPLPTAPPPNVADQPALAPTGQPGDAAMQQFQQINPMTPPEMNAFNNSVPAASMPEIAARLGINPNIPGAMIDLRQLAKGGASLINSGANREVKLLALGMDSDGNPLPDDQLPPAVLYKKHQMALADAQVELAQARAAGIPEQIKLAQGRLDVARQNAQTSARRVGLLENIAGSGGAAAGLAGADRETVLASVDPITRANVEGVLNYQVNPQTFSNRGGHRERIIGLARLIDPSYDQTQYATRAGLRKDFTSGKGAANIRSINTLVDHLSKMQEAGNALQNGDVQLWNKIANAGLSATGDPRVTRFMMAANAVETELATVFKNTGATDQEIKAWREQLNASMSPSQIAGAIQQAVALMGGRLGAISEQWESGMGKPRDFRILQPKAQRILEQMGFDPSELDSAAVYAHGIDPSSSGLTPPPQPPAAKQYKMTATGQKGQKIGSDDGNNWFDVATGKKVQ